MNTKTKFLSITTILSVVLFLILSESSTYANHSIDEPDSAPFGKQFELIYPPDSAPFNTKFKEWSAQWWQFVLSLPAAENPVIDDTGSKCVVGQRGPVWFLMGTFGGQVSRTCNIPAGKSLFFPVLNQADINVTNQTAAELRAEIAPCIDAVTNLSVEVDNHSVIVFDKRNKFRVKSEVFDATVPENGLLEPGIYSPVVDDGFYVMLRPLAPGSHTVHISAARQGCPFSPDPFSLDVTYSLNVVPVSLK